MKRWAMGGLQAELAKLGHPFVRAARVRSLEAAGAIPPAERDLRGARMFGPEHVAAIAARLESGRQSAKQPSGASPARSEVS
jgi:hypothetical protein